MAILISRMGQDLRTVAVQRPLGRTRLLSSTVFDINRVTYMLLVSRFLGGRYGAIFWLGIVGLGLDDVDEEFVVLIKTVILLRSNVTLFMSGLIDSVLFTRED